jgi:ferredoxin
MGCVGICPVVFSLNEATGYIQVADLPSCPDHLVKEAIKYCPVDAIYWEPSE